VKDGETPVAKTTFWIYFQPMLVALLVLDEVFDTGLAVVRDAFETANAVAASSGRPSVRFDVRELGVRGRIRSHQGRSISPLRAGSLRRRPELVIVPGILPGPAKTRELALEGALERPEVREAASLLGEWFGRGATCAAACTSTFVLAKSGLLDGRLATTTWWLAPLFRQLFPEVELDERRMVVDEGSIVTAGAAMAHLDLALALIGRESPEVGRRVAEYLLVDARPSQAPYMAPSFLARADPLVERFERWARERLERGFTIAEAAEAIGSTERTLVRRVRRLLGRAPISYVQDLRIERAVHLLKTTDSSLEQVAFAVGYQNASTLGQLLRKKLGQTTRGLRAAAF
jgi:transcriptional regulator GlxA family with amidase domain